MELTAVHIYDMEVFMVWCLRMDFNYVWHLFPVQVIVMLGEQDLTKAVTSWYDLQPESPKDV
jgi:hypothetical protein